MVHDEKQCAAAHPEKHVTVSFTAGNNNDDISTYVPSIQGHTSVSLLDQTFSHSSRLVYIAGKQIRF